ncbi:lysylphosphatidylglycerol synthase transmembrane domain-containing protein [Hydrogenophaga sp. 2FB]|uniref:lysylphosphatidylglycerol synthase transmembrane domain-containing protein n=1 Tax=Hydrogenophaga sp. 2FB TaxID=2502187 RepID=UPI0010F8FE5E|nr:lysylphosphatidylglycerol synthase transmembrane domain-containing protein [Hydrogenophaga sp. 2FB]
MNRWRQHALTLIGLAVSLIAIGWLLSNFDLSEVARTLARADLTILLPLPLILIASFALRTQRWRLVVEHEPPVHWWPGFRALMIGYLLNNVLPARAGDVARALELGRTEQMSRTKVFATLVVERTADLAFMLALLSVVLLSYPAIPEWLKQAGLAVTAITVLAMSLLAAAHLLGKRLIPWLHRRLLQRLPIQAATRVQNILASALDGIAGGFRLKHFTGFLALTVVIWVLEVALVWLIARAIGLDLAPGNALFVLLLIAIGTMVPASPGFVGTYEFFGVAALGMLQVHGAQALAFVVLLHLATLLGSTLIGALCFLARPAAPSPRAIGAQDIASAHCPDDKT